MPRDYPGSDGAGAGWEWKFVCEGCGAPVWVFCPQHHDRPTPFYPFCLNCWARRAAGQPTPNGEKERLKDV